MKISAGFVSLSETVVFGSVEMTRIMSFRRGCVYWDVHGT